MQQQQQQQAEVYIVFTKIRIKTLNRRTSRIIAQTTP